MPITTPQFASNNLPLWFYYEMDYGEGRVSKLDTLTTSVYQSRPYAAADESFIFKLDFATVTIRNLFLNAWKNKTETTFKDFDGTTHNVVVLQYKETEVGSEYNISGKMCVIGS